MDTAPTAKTGISVPWSDDDLFVLLCTLNFRIGDIRSSMKKDQKTGILFASQIISEAIGNGCAPLRVQRKIKSLWARWGSPEGGSEPYNIYTYGAFPKTLPGYNWSLLKKVAAHVKEMQSKPGTETPSDDLNPRALRRSQRNVRKTDYNDLVHCRCGFTHDILWIHCDNCETWQHAFCYYHTEDEDKLPNHHQCDDCDPSNEVSQINWEMAKLKFGQPRHTATLGPFGLPIDDEVMWGPEDEDVEKHLFVIQSQFRRIATSLEPEMDLSRVAVSATNWPDTRFLVDASLGSEDEIWLRPEFLDPDGQRPKRRQILRAFLAAALKAWVYQAEKPRHTGDSALLYHYQQEIFVKHGEAVLQSLHRRAYVRMMEDKPASPLEEATADEAEQLSKRWLTAIVPLTTQAQQQRAVPTLERWLASSAQGPLRLKMVTQMFACALKFRNLLPLAKQCFEFYAPAPGCHPAEGQAVLEDESGVETSQVIKLCLMPAVLEYPSEWFVNDSSGPGVLFSERNIVKASREQRAKARTVSPALVVII